MPRALPLSAGAVSLLLAAFIQLQSGLTSTLSATAVALALLGLLNLQAGAPSEQARPTKTKPGSNALLVAASVVAAGSALPALGTLAMPLLGAALSLAALGVALRFVRPATGSPKQERPRQHRAPRQRHASQGRETGTVKWFNTSKGFGFISRDSGEDIFVHFRAIRGEGHRVLSEGERVEFAITQREKGLQAEDVVSLG